jgi:hypothetical protein
MHVAPQRLASEPHSYELHVGSRATARLEWRDRPGGAAGWYLDHFAGTSRRLIVDPALDTPAVGGDDWAPILSTALALDEAARILTGAPARPARPVPTGAYEVHVAGLPAATLPLTFPEATVVAAADTGILIGHFDDAGLTAIVRRIGLLGGRLLALLPA